MGIDGLESSKARAAKARCSANELGGEQGVNMETGGEEIILVGPVVALRASRVIGLSNERPRAANEIQLGFAPGGSLHHL